MNFGLIFSLNSSPAASFPPAIFQTGFEMWFTTQTREVLSPPQKKSKNRESAELVTSNPEVFLQVYRDVCV